MWEPEQYDPASHYWVLADGRVWSSGQASYVRADDEAYLAWLETGAAATLVDGEEQVRDALSRGGCPDRAPGMLSYSAFRARWEPAELSALAAALTTNPDVLEVIVTAHAQRHVNLGGNAARDAKALFVSLGILGADRAEVIFARG